MREAQEKVNNNRNFQTMTNAFSKPYEDLIKHLIPVLGAAAAIFLASVSAPKLGQQFAGAAFKFLNQVGGALMTGAAVAVGAFAGAAAGAATSGAKEISEAKGIGGKLKALGKTAVNAPVRGFGALAKEGVAGGLRAAITPIPAEMRKEMVGAWTRRVSAEAAAKHIEDVEKKKGPKSVQDIVENKFKTASDLERMEAIKKAVEGGYYKEEWMKDEGIKNLTLRTYTETAKRRDKKLMGTIERRLVASLGEEFGKIAEREGVYTAEDKAKDKARGIDTYTKKIIASVRTADDIKQLQRKWRETPGAMEVVLTTWGGPQLGKAAEEFERDFVDEYIKKAEEKGPEWFVANNPRALLYLSGNAAQDFGFTTPGNWSREKVRAAIRHAREVERRERKER
jgi:hypothetical protein